MNVMKPIANDTLPIGNEWLYEVKYDGFRCVLHWEKDSIKLLSKNAIDLTEKFPEIVQYCVENQSSVNEFLPLKFDGELVVLNNDYQANFPWIQRRGRMKNEASIREISESRPASLMVFDLLQHKGFELVKKDYYFRKGLLKKIVHAAEFGKEKTIIYVKSHENHEQLWRLIYEFKGEGVIAKRKTSPYVAGKKHRDWFKIKNWRTVTGFLTFMDVVNGYFTVGVYDGDAVQPIGKCKHGLEDASLNIVKQIFLQKGEKQEGGYALPPAICTSIHTLDFYKDELREPVFKAILPTVKPTECTLQRTRIDMAMIPDKINLTNVNKVFWPEKKLTKGHLLTYMREVSPYMLPFLKDKALTVIRSPEGIYGKSFFQKNVPDYAPSYIDTVEMGTDKRIVCNHLDTLIWFANHGAIEYHVPFQKVDSAYPNEIVFDLDPPDRKSFPLAIQAALIIKSLLDEMNLISFVKTSGNKGLQIHIPIRTGTMTYEQTALFTQGIAWAVESAYPNLFTTERLKKYRKGRLYIDYVQHGKDKTIIAPYSPRNTVDATVATPLNWDEVKEGLRPDYFTMDKIIERIHRLGCPFGSYVDARHKQEVNKVLSIINK